MMYELEKKIEMDFFNILMNDEIRFIKNMRF